MMTDVYQHVRHHETVDDLVDWATGGDVPIVGIDNLPGSVAIESTELPEACVLFFDRRARACLQPPEPPLHGVLDRSYVIPAVSMQASPPALRCTHGFAAGAVTSSAER